MTLTTLFRVEDIELRDGARLALRPIEPEDKDALVDGLGRMGEESRYRRFLTPLREFSGAQLRYLTEVDHDDHEALIALDREEIVGVARYVRLEPAGRRAEMAITVVDDWQGRGLGSALLDRICTRAHASGITTFTATVAGDNRAMLALLRAIGPIEITHAGDGLLELDVELGTGSLERLLRQAAAGLVDFVTRVGAAIEKPGS